MENPVSRWLDRRSFLALLGSTLSATITGGCRTLPERGSGVDDPRLSAIVEVLLPRTSSPGGGDTATASFVARMLDGPLPAVARDAIARGLAALDAACSTVTGRAFAALDPLERARLVGWIDAAAFDSADSDGAALRTFWLTMKQLIVVGHFTSRDAIESQLLYDPLPGVWQADAPRMPDSRVSYCDRTGVPYLLAIPL